MKPTLQLQVLNDLTKTKYLTPQILADKYKVDKDRIRTLIYRLSIRGFPIIRERLPDHTARYYIDSAWKDPVQKCIGLFLDSSTGRRKDYARKQK